MEMVNASSREIGRLESLYAGCRAYHGEMHDHSASGGTSDGTCTLAEWITELAERKMDFAAILDHRQVRHMYLPEWRDGLFIGGSEPGTRISDSPAANGSLHYNMVFEGPEPLEALLAEFPEFRFTGGPEGHFVYPSFTRERFGTLIDTVKAHGGFFVHPHPKQVMVSDDPLDYWFRDETGIEVFYNSADSAHTEANYALWLSLLAAGKRVWACAGGDWHAHPDDRALTTIYAEAQTNADFLAHLRIGDFTCGAVGIRMCIGGTKTGGICPFDGNRLVVSAGDFHVSAKKDGHAYRLVILDDTGEICGADISADETVCFSVPAGNGAFLRAEVLDTTDNLRIAVGNPIWNAGMMIE